MKSYLFISSHLFETVALTNLSIDDILVIIKYSGRSEQQID